MSKFIIKKRLDKEWFDKLVKASNERIKKVKESTKIDPIDLLRIFD